MKIFAISALSFALAGSPLFGLPFQSSDPSSQSTNSQDVPTQKPATNNPDVGKQRHPATAPSTGHAQRQADVPHQKPNTESPDIAKERHAPPAKKKRGSKSTTNSTDSTTTN